MFVKEGTEMLVQMFEKYKFFFKLLLLLQGLKATMNKWLSRSMKEMKNTPSRFCVEYSPTSVKF